MLAKVIPNFWEGKKVFLTGHTGFKGSWLSVWLSMMGARVYGYGLPPNTTPSMYQLLKVEELLDFSNYADVRDLNTLRSAIAEFQPDIVIHMAAQPLVRYSYEFPIETYEVNIMGTVNLLDCLRNISSIKATVIVTTDKCYENREWEWGYRENEPMGGYDPYSSSKGCAELIVSAYRRSFFGNTFNSIATARAGNVIGGGDWSCDRLIPDALRAFQVNESLVLRNPTAIRPWQHVLEPLSGYLMLGQALFEKGNDFSSGWNFAPRDSDMRTVEEVLALLIERLGGGSWCSDLSVHPHEAKILKLDSSKAKHYLGWEPKWSIETSIKNIASWHFSWLNKSDLLSVTQAQIDSYMNVNE
jgi:CDP-glucose 4,6-dehydratase